MAVTSYYSVNGNLLGEKSTGSNRVDYLSDALGSVTATVNSSATVVNTYRYKPYGTQLAKTGVGTDPAFTWVGQWGYQQTSKQFSDVYVRARHYSNQVGRWNTHDPATEWVINVYRYAMSNPINSVDPTGAISIRPTLKSQWIIGSAGECGKARAYWDFWLDKSPALDGYFVQEISYTQYAIDCPSGSEIHYKTKFWEAWFVSSPSRTDQNRYGNYTDRFEFPTTPYTKTGGGFLAGNVVHGSVKFFYSSTKVGGKNENNKTVHSEVVRWDRTGCSEWSANLCTTKQPTWFNANPPKEVVSEGSADHFMQSSWNCCPCDTKFNSSSAYPS